MAARHRPVTVALNGIDFAIVREMAKRLGQTPLRPGVSGKSLMKYTEIFPDILAVIRPYFVLYLELDVNTKISGPLPSRSNEAGNRD